MNFLKIITIIIISIQGYSQADIIYQKHKTILRDSTIKNDTNPTKTIYGNNNDVKTRFNCEIINGDAPSMIKRAKTYLLQGHYQWATVCFERAIKSDSISVQAYLGLARIARVNNDSVTYRIMLNKAKSININDSEVFYEINHIWDWNKENDSLNISKRKNR